MIKPVQLAEDIVKLGTKAVQKNGSEALNNVAENTEALPKVNGELLQSYCGVNTQKLFENFSDFVSEFKTKLLAYRNDIPEGLYKKLNEMSDIKDFSLQKAVGEYYSGLENCKTLEEVKKLYPEIKVPNLNFEEEIAQDIKNLTSKNICDEVAKLKTPDEKKQLLDNYYKEKISKQVEKWEIYPEFQTILDNVEQEIIDGKFTGKITIPKYNQNFNTRMPLRYRLMHTKDRELAVIDILKQHFIQGKGFNEINLKTFDGSDISAQRLKHTISIGELDKNFKLFIKLNESKAEMYQKLASLDKHQINSAIMTQTWKSSRLRVDLGNETAYKKDWSLVKPVWQKTMFSDTTFYPTDKLIDVYLLGLFKNGKIVCENPNPLKKHLETPFLDKNQIMLLKRLYKLSKDLDMDKQILKSDKFQEFKSQFDLNDMKKSIEVLEEHYKNAFFKHFWTDERKMRFANALHRNKELANRNINISEDILTRAMDTVFS